MEEIKAPKKERKFLKAVGNIAKVLVNELVMGIARKFIGKAIDKVGNKRQGLVVAFLLVAGISYASIDSIPYPLTGNKQRLGWQTSGNGLVYRGRSNDTITKPSSYVDKNVKAYLLLDSVRGTIFVWRQTYWDSILVGGGGGTFAQPIDSLFFDTSVPTNNVETAKMRWDSDLATVVLGLNDNVPNELGFKNFWLVKNQTGSTIAKGSLVYANGTVGASGRITVDKFIANGSIDAKYLLGITAHDLTDGEDGYVISFGKIRQVNTDTFAAGAILYPSPTVAGVWTDVEPVAPNIDMPIGFCINSSANNGTIAIRVASGYKLSELHDVAISSPVEKSSLYYSGGLWRDTTAALLVSDTASMLANYATKAYADTTGRFYARQEFRNVSSSTLTWTQSDTLVVNDTTSLQVYRNGQILMPNQYTVPTSTSVVIASSSYKAGENYTVIFPRGGGGGGSGSGSLTSISAGTGITVSPNPITTTGTVSADLSVLMELTDTSLLNLTSRFASKLNTTDTASLSNRINAKGDGTVTSVGNGYGLLSTQSPITTSGVIRVDSSTVYNYVRDSIVKVRIGNDTIKILKQEYNNVITDTLTWTTTNKFPIQLRAFILLFRNGQLLINDQYSVIDTNKIKIASTSYKVGENYTLVTVSGIGSANVSQTGNPVYPEAGIALSTGTTWTTSIPNNSSNWNTAFTDRLKWDGGSTGLVAATGRTSLGGTTIGQSMFTLTNPSAITFPRFNADNTVEARSAANFRSDIGAGTVTSVTASGTAGNPLSITNTTTTPTIELLSATSGRNGYLTSTDWTTFNGKQNALSNASSTVSGILTSTDWTTFNNKQNTITLTTTGTSGASTLVGSTLNIPQYTSGGGTVTNVTGTLPISVTNGTTTPDISISNASTTTSGVVTTGTQSFSGAKTFTAATIINGGLIVNDDGSSVGIFRVEGDNTTSLIQTAPANDYVGIGRAPENSFDVQGAVRFRTLTLNGTPTRIIGADATGDINQITLGTGLSLSSGTLSATGGSGTVTNVTGTLPISVTNGTTTPSITIADAGTGASGVVNTSTQSFAGNKTFTGTVTLNSATGTATSVIGRSSTGQVVGVSLNTGLGISGGSLSLDFKTVLTIGTDFPSTNAQSSSDLTFTVTGASVGQPVLLGVPDGSAPANTNYTAWVSASNTVKIRFNNYSASTVNPAAGDFTIRVFNL